MVYMVMSLKIQIEPSGFLCPGLSSVGRLSPFHSFQIFIKGNVCDQIHSGQGSMNQRSCSHPLPVEVMQPLQMFEVVLQAQTHQMPVLGQGIGL